MSLRQCCKMLVKSSSMSASAIFIMRSTIVRRCSTDRDSQVFETENNTSLLMPDNFAKSECLIRLGLDTICSSELSDSIVSLSMTRTHHGSISLVFLGSRLSTLIRHLALQCCLVPYRRCLK